MKKRMAWLMSILLLTNMMSTPVLAETEMVSEKEETAVLSGVLDDTESETPLLSDSETEKLQMQAEAVKTVENIVGYDVNGFGAFRTITVERGTNLEELGLPDTLEAVVNGELLSVPVSWKCIDDSFGGSNYVPAHENNAAVFTFQAELGEGYAAGGNLALALANGKTLPWIEVRYQTEENQNMRMGGLTEQSLPATDDNGKLKYRTGNSEITKAFDIQGIDGNSIISTTYQNAGYELYLYLDSKSSTKIPINVANGKIQTIDSDIQCQPLLNFTEDGAFIRISYNFYNSGSASHTLNICGGADIKIGTYDDAPINRSKTGFTMVGGSNQFSFFGKNTYGVTPVDTYWFGDYSSRSSNYFNNAKIDSLTGTDSGMAFSWQDRVIAPGETKTFTILLGVGEASNPPELDVTNDIELDYNNNKVTVEAKVTENVNRTYNLYYAIDGGAKSVLNITGHGTNPIPGSGSQETISGEVDASGWQENSVHTVEIWAQNDKNAMSEVKSVRIAKLSSGETTEVVKRTISFDKNGADGKGPDSVNGEELTAITLPEQGEMTWTGASFEGWKDGVNTYRPGTKYTIPIGSDVELTAVWKVPYSTEYYLENETAGQYLKDDLNSGSGNGTPGEFINAEEKIFDHYVLDKSIQGTAASGNIAVSASGSPLTLKLFYKRAEQTVTFETNGGTLKNVGDVSRKVRWGTKLGTLPELEERPGYTLLGWVSDMSESGVSINTDTQITSDQTVYADWVINELQVSDLSDIAITYGDTITEQTITVGDGSGNYSFSAENLPAGLTLSAEGKLSGKPIDVTNDVVEVCVTVTDKTTMKTAEQIFTVKVDKKALTVLGGANTTKIYDADLDIVVGGLTLFGVLEGDSVTASATANFTDASSGINKLIQLSEIQLSGNDRGKYAIESTASIRGTIEKRDIKLTASAVAKKTGEQNPVPVLKEPGTSAIQGSDTLASLGTPVFDFSKVAETAGIYAVSLSMENPNPNYNITCTGTTMTVTQVAPLLGVHYSTSGTEGLDQWFTSAAVLRPVGGYDKIVNQEGNSIDSLTVTDETKEMTFYLKNTTTGEFTAKVTATLKSDTQPPVFGEVSVRTKNDGVLAAIGRTLTFGHFFKETVEVSIAATDVGSGMKTVEYLLPDTAWQRANLSDGKAVFDIPLGTDGTIKIKASDNAGNMNTESDLTKDGISVWVVENIAPQIADITAEGNISNGWYKEDVTVKTIITDTDSGLNQVTYKVDTDAAQMLLENPTNRVDSYELEQTIRKEGETTVVVGANDNAKNVGTEKTKTIKIDKTLPQIGDIAGNPEKWQKEEAVLSFTLSDTGSGIDKNSVSVTVNQVQVRVLEKNGVYTFTTIGNGMYVISANDFAGNAMIPKTVSVSKIQTVKPEQPNVSDVDQSITNGSDPDDTTGFPSTPDGWYTTNGVIMNITNPEAAPGSAPQHYVYRIWEEGTSLEDAEVVVFDGTNSPAFTEDGVWNIEIWLEDEAGNHSESVTKTMHIDAGKPEISEISGNPEIWQNEEAKLTFELTDTVSGIDKTSVSVTLNGNPIVVTEEDGVWSFSADTNGDYVVTARDLAGNTLETKTVTVTKLQLQEPEKPNSDMLDESLSNGGEPGDTTGFPSTPDGWYTTNEVIMNITNPEAAPGSAPQHYVYRIWEEGTSLEDAEVVVFDGTNIPSFTEDGVWNIEIWLEDEAGNHSESVTKTMHIDAGKPEISEISGNPEIWQNEEAKLTFELTDTVSGIDKTSVSVTLNGNPIVVTEEDGVWSFSADTNGDYVVTARDLAGNTLEAKTVTVAKLQLQEPEKPNSDMLDESLSNGGEPGDTTGFPSTPDGWYTTNEVIMNITNPEAAPGSAPQHYVYRIWEEGTSLEDAEVVVFEGTNIPSFTEDGVWNIEIWLEDEAGNHSESVIKTLHIDAAKPEISEVSGNPEHWQNEEAKLTFELTDAVSGIDKTSVSITLDGLPVTAVEENGVWSFNAAVNGDYIITARDNAGNVLESKTVTVTKLQLQEPLKPEQDAIDGCLSNGGKPGDTTGFPTTPDGWYTTKHVEMNLTNPEVKPGNAQQYYVYRIWEEGINPEDAEVVKFDGSNPPVFTKEGIWNVEIWLEDEAGNHSESVIRTLPIDGTIPVTTAKTDHLLTKNGISQKAEVFFEDAVSGMNPDTVKVTFQGKNVESKTKIVNGKVSCIFDVVKGGLYTVTGQDAAGNMAEFSVVVTALQVEIETGTGIWGICDKDEILDAVDLSKYKNGETVTVLVKITPVSGSSFSEAEKKMLKKQMRSDAKLFGFDISIFKQVEEMNGTKTTEELVKTDKSVKMTVTIPENLRGKYNYQILRLHGNDCTVLESSLSKDGTYITFSSDQFSSYALTYTNQKEIPVKTPNAPKTADKTPVAATAAATALAALLATLLVYKKIRRSSIENQ